MGEPKEGTDEKDDERFQDGIDRLDLVGLESGGDGEGDGDRLYKRAEDRWEVSEGESFVDGEGGEMSLFRSGSGYLTHPWKSFGKPVTGTVILPSLSAEKNSLVIPR